MGEIQPVDVAYTEPKEARLRNLLPLTSCHARQCACMWLPTLYLICVTNANGGHHKAGVVLRGLL